jgi:hypothetical protein
MSYEVHTQVPPPRSRTLRRAGVIGALAVGLVAGGFGIASAASPTPTPTQSTPTQPNGACPHAGGPTATEGSGATTANLTGGSDLF